MQRLPSRGKSAGRPATLQNTKSFSRFEAAPASTPHRARATTVQGVPVPDYAAITESPSSWRHNGDVFEHPENEIATDDEGERSAQEELATSVEDLPDELRELLDSFLESLSAKVHPTPLSIDKLSELFQDFYEHAQTRIEEHIALLAQRYPGSSVQTPSIRSASSALSKGGGRRTLRSSARASPRADGDHQQMLTPAEVQNRRKIRKQLEVRKRALEELVEQEVCERVYSRVWRHRTTDDEERDEKLRSRAAALAVIGISLKELLSSAMSNTANLQSTTEQENSDAKERLTEARRFLEKMNHEKYPLGKLNHLKAAHKSIVETLQQLFPSSSSADEVLPTLIYSIITSKPDTSHTVSNFNYIQRFRNETKIDGEAAYCLTNLEAAITFLETVDLSSIRASEKPEGPERSASRPETPQHEIPNPLYHGLPSDSESPSPQKPKTLITKTRSRASSSATTRPRGSSFMSQPPSRGSEYPVTPTDAVRQAADEALDAMHNALDNSFKFFFGRLKERQGDAISGRDGNPLTPKTLADAHKLVSEQPAEDEDEFGDEEPARPTSRDENSNALLRAIGGMRSRERSVDSGRSNDSARKISYGLGSSPAIPVGRSSTIPATNATIHAFGSSPPAPQPSAPSAVDTMRNLGNSLNPLKGWGGVGMMRGFGRNVSGTSPIGTSSPTSVSTVPAPTTTTMEKEAEKKKLMVVEEDTMDKIDISGLAPGIEKFVECKDARELTGHDVDVLLRDYQRLAGALKAAAAATSART